MQSKISKITIKGKAKIVVSDDETLVVKEKKKDLKPLFDYLSKRDIDFFPLIIEEDESSIKYKYYETIENFQIDNDSEIARLVSDLHYKTAYFKTVSRKKYKDIYNTLIDNTDYLKDYYNSLISEIDNETYMSPSNYLLARNFNIIMGVLLYIEKELNLWYNLVKDKTRERVCIVHNNLRKDNFLNGDKTILLSWDNYLVDTPVLDIYKFYKNEYKTIDFKSFLQNYNDTFKLTKEEQKLLFIMISFPRKINETSSEYEKVKDTKELLDYIYRTNEVIKSNIFN